MKFSVITPSYNQGNFLEQTIKSVISQTGDFEIEYFVFDGGSTDNSVNILKRYDRKLKGNDKIKFFWQSKKDNGQVDAINLGLKKVTGDVVSYINSDDYYLPGAFQAVFKFFKDNPDKEWLAGNCEVSKKNLKWTFWLKHIWPVNLFPQALLIFNTINQPAVFMKKPLAEKVGSFNNKYHYAFDYDYWLRCSKSSLPGRTTIQLATFRVHQESKGNTGYDKQFSEDMIVAGKYTSNLIIKFIHKIAGLFVKWSYGFLK